MQNSLLFIHLLIVSLLVGCGDAQTAGNGVSEGDAGSPSQPGVAPGTVAFTIKGTLTNYAGQDSIFLYDQFGGELRRMTGTTLNADDGKATFEMTGKVPMTGIYVLNFSPEQGLELVVGEDETIVFEADGKNIFGTANFTEASPSNATYHEFQLQVARFQQAIQQNNQKIQQMQKQGQGQEAQQLQQQNAQLFGQQLEYVDKFVGRKGVIGKVAKVFQYEPYNPETHRMYADGKAYYIENFVASADFSDPQIGYIPVTANKFQSYGQALLMQHRLDLEAFRQAVDRYIKKAPEGSKLRKLLLYATLNAAANSKRHPNRIDLYVIYSKQFVEQFPDDPFAAKVEGDVKKYGGTIVGSKAPDIAQTDPDGKTRKLSDVNAKLILVDFWASWCGPCRRENPRVVKLYDAYKDKGFDIFSVSLDKNKNKWLQAIEADGLKWPNHVSDLKGWQNGAAQQYGVTSIPSTLLIDSEGKIIAKNVRGPALEKKVADILGK